MPASPKAPQNLFTMALAFKKGDQKLEDFPANMRNQVKRVADSISKEDANALASGPRTAKPQHVIGRPTRIRHARSA